MLLSLNVNKCLKWQINWIKIQQKKNTFIPVDLCAIAWEWLCVCLYHGFLIPKQTPKYGKFHLPIYCKEKEVASNCATQSQSQKKKIERKPCYRVRSNLIAAAEWNADFFICAKWYYDTATEVWCVKNHSWKSR